MSSSQTKHQVALQRPKKHQEDGTSVRIEFELTPQAWHNSSSETLWAMPLSATTYLLQNSPFYVYGVSYGDTVEGMLVDGRLCATSVVAKGGHSTYRIILRPDKAESFNEAWQPLQALGCTYELGNGVYAVDVPENTNIFEVYKLLQRGEDVEIWDFDEGHCGHTV
jgi:hypothetical protein